MGENITKAVTGATGHIGEALVRQLVNEPGEVRAVIRKNPGSLPQDAKKVSGDLRDPESLAQAFQGCTEVYNLAAIISLAGDPDGQVWKTNVEGARNVAQAAAQAGVKRLVHCSSIQAFVGPGRDGVLDETAPRAIADHQIAAWGAISVPRWLLLRSTKPNPKAKESVSNRFFSKNKMKRFVFKKKPL